MFAIFSLRYPRGEVVSGRLRSALILSVDEQLLDAELAGSVEEIFTNLQLSELVVSRQASDAR